MLVARKQQTLDDVKATIKRYAADAQVLTVPTDVTKPKQVQAAVKAAIDAFGRLDVCIANAGTASHWDRRQCLAIGLLAVD